MKTVIRSLVIASTLVASSVFAQPSTPLGTKLCIASVDAAFKLRDQGKSHSYAKNWMLTQVEETVSLPDLRDSIRRVVSVTVDVVYNGNVSRDQLKKACP